jgi:hypothetical protein
MEPKKVYEYEIGGRLFIQRPLVLGQLRQLTEEMKGLVIEPGTELSLQNIIGIFGEKISRGIAIVLTPKDFKLKDKDVDTLTEELEYEMDIETTFKVVEDFFDCNPLSSLLNKFTSLMHKAGGTEPKIDTETGLQTP